MKEKSTRQFQKYRGPAPEEKSFKELCDEGPEGSADTARMNATPHEPKYATECFRCKGEGIEPSDDESIQDPCIDCGGSGFHISNDPPITIDRIVSSDCPAGPDNLSGDCEEPGRVIEMKARAIAMAAKGIKDLVIGDSGKSMNELLAEKDEKKRIDSIIYLLAKGGTFILNERPEGMSFDDFKIIRRELQRVKKRYLKKGTLTFIAKEIRNNSTSSTEKNQSIKNQWSESEGRTYIKPIEKK